MQFCSVSPVTTHSVFVWLFIRPQQRAQAAHGSVLIKLRRYIYTKLKGCERWPVWRLNRTLFLSHTESKEFQAEEFLPVAGLFLKAEIPTTNHLGQSRRLQSNC